MPIISVSFGIIRKINFEDHSPPYFRRILPNSIDLVVCFFIGIVINCLRLNCDFDFASDYIALSLRSFVTGLVFFLPVYRWLAHATVSQTMGKKLCHVYLEPLNDKSKISWFLSAYRSLYELLWGVLFMMIIVASSQLCSVEASDTFGYTPACTRFNIYAEYFIVCSFLICTLRILYIVGLPNKKSGLFAPKLSYRSTKLVMKKNTIGLKNSIT